MRRFRAITTASALVALVVGAISETSVAVVSKDVPRPTLAAPTAGGAPTLGDWVASRAARARMAPGSEAASSWVKSTGISRPAWKSALADPLVRVGANGRAFVVEPVMSPAERAAISAQSATPVEDIPVSDAFLLNSKPDSLKTIYLDFTGHTISGTEWNDADIPDGTYFQAFDQDGTPGSFSNAERQAIIDAWSLISEDYAPFDVNVTTQDPGTAAIHRSSYADDAYGSRAVITSGSNPIADTCGCGGVAYVGVFGYPQIYGDYTPAWAFAGAGDSGKIIADIVSHEVGHNLGLSHDGLATVAGGDPLDDNAYYLGADAWAPIMGAGYYRAITQWSDGDYSGISQADNSTAMVGNNIEDDFDVMQDNGLFLRDDDVGDAWSGAHLIAIGEQFDGVISGADDSDYFSFVAEGTAVSIQTGYPSLTPNLDVSLTAHDSAHTQIGLGNPAVNWSDGDLVSGMDAQLSLCGLTVGSTYFVVVDGSDEFSEDAIYSDYGSVGEYSLVVSDVSSPHDQCPEPTLSAAPVVGQVVTAVTGTWSPSTSFTYQWKRGSTVVGTGSSYTPVQADQPWNLTVSVTGSAVGKTSVTRTSVPLAVSPGNFSAAPTPTISGTAKVGVSLTANEGTWSPVATFTYQWKRGLTVVGTARTYTPVAADRGSTLTVSVTGSATGVSSQTKTSAATSAVAYGTISPAPTPSVSGTKRVGRTLTAITGTWKSGVVKTYRWQRCSVSTGSCSNISGATSKTYKLKSTDRGKRIRVKVGGTLAGYTTMVKTSSKTSIVTW